MRILNFSKYNLQTKPICFKLNILKDDLLKLHELKFYFKYMHKKLPAYLLNWKITPNIHSHNTMCTTDIYLFMNLPKRCLIYNLPHVINNTKKK